MAKKGKASKTKLKARRKAAAPKKTGKQKTAKAAKSPNLGVVPRWDLSNVYPGLESDQFEAAVQDLKTQLDELDAYTQAHRIGKSENGPVQGNTDELARVLADYLDKTNRILRLYATRPPGGWIPSWISLPCVCASRVLYSAVGSAEWAASCPA
jgi:hypothetical protein